MQYFRATVLICVLQLSLAVIPTEQVKFAIKAHSEDSCIRAKSSREVVIEKCYWKTNDNYSTNRKVLENEQTFDVHPADDITERQEVETQNSSSNVPTSFLIRLFKSQKSSPFPSNTGRTSCLASISSRLSIEKCQLRKARFFISGTTLEKPSCSKPDHALQADHIRFKICASDQSCLQLKSTNATGKSLAFTKETTEKFANAHLWQFCGKNGNCSLSLETVAWTTFIKIKFPQQIIQNVCQDEHFTTTMTPSASVTTTTSANLTKEKLEITTQAHEIFDNSTPTIYSSGVLHGHRVDIPTFFITIVASLLSVSTSVVQYSAAVAVLNKQPTLSYKSYFYPK